MAASLTLCLTLLALAEAALPAYPYYAIPGRSVPAPAQPLHQPSAALVHPYDTYRLTNVANNTYQIKGQDLVFGAKAPQDKLLLHTIIYKRAGIWSNYATKEITFPPPGSHVRVNITQVNAYDRGKNGTGGFVKMVGGGIGRESVTLLFKSQKNRPINFEVDVFGVARA